MHALALGGWRFASSSFVAAVIALVAPAGAGAGPLAASATDCDDQQLGQTFAPWLDPMYYTPLAGGSFEGGSEPWSLAGGAAVVDGNESAYVGGAGDASSLRLPARSTATSPVICVGLDHPTVRLFVQRTSGVLASVKVEVLYEDGLGEPRSLPIGVLTGGPRWQPSLPLPIVANLLPLLPGNLTPVAFRFTSSGGDFRIDDVYVDPRHSS